MASIISAGTTSSTALNISADTSGVLQLASNNGTVAVTVDTSQNLGIGTTSPTAKLDVRGSGSFITATNPQTFWSVDSALTTHSMYAQFNTTNVIGTMGTYTSDPLAFVTGNTERMRIASGGNVLLRITNPSVYDTNGGSDVSGYWNFQTASANDTSDKFIAGAGSGAIFGGTTNNTSGNPIINSYIRFANVSNTAGSETGSIIFYTKPSSNSASNNVGMTLNSSGFLVMTQLNANGQAGQMQVGVTSSTGINGCLAIAANASGAYPLAINALSTGQGLVGWFYNSGLVTSISIAGGNTISYGTTSDYRLKENVQPMTGALAKVEKLNPVTYTWKSNGLAGQGFIAHELQEVIPDAVVGEKDAIDEDGKIVNQSVDTSFLVATLTAAIQELNAKVTALENK